MSATEDLETQIVLALERGDHREALELADSLDSSSLLDMAIEGIANGCHELVAQFLNRGLDVNARRDNSTLLKHGVRRGSVPIVQLLLERGADVDDGVVLVGAVQGGNIDVVRLLIDAGADVDKGFPDFPTPLGMAQMLGKTEIAELLVAHGATKLVGGVEGGQVFRHGEGESLEPAPRGRHREKLRAALSERFGPVARSVDVPVTDAIELTLHWVEPAKGRAFHTVFTEGMSDRTTTGEHAPEPRRTELVLRLPAEWSMEDALDPGGAPQWRWPIEELVALAHLPHRHATSLAEGDTVPNGDPPEPLHESTELAGWLLVPGDDPVGEALVVRGGWRTKVHVLAPIAVHPAEMRMKLTHGIVPLMQALGWSDLSPVLDPTRPSVAAT